MIITPDDDYSLSHPKIKMFIDKTIREAKEKGYARILIGRIHYLSDISSSNRTLQEFSARQVANTSIQGTVADIIKLAMVDV